MLADPVVALARLGGSAAVGSLDDLCGRKALRRAVRDGTVVRLARGRYGLPQAPDPVRSAVRLRGVVSHESAAEHWGIEVPRSVDRRAQVTVRRGRSHLDTSGVEVHWADVPASDLDSGFTTPLRTVLDLARLREFGPALAAADCALRKGLVLPSDLRAGADALRGPGCVRARLVAQHADGRAASVLESILRAILVRAGVVGFEPQIEIRDDAFYARVDLAHPGLRIVIEADSFEHHGGRSALARDCRRYSELTVRGWRVLRFAWEHVVLEPEWVERVVLDALAVGPAGTMRRGHACSCCGEGRGGERACPADR